MQQQSILPIPLFQQGAKIDSLELKQESLVQQVSNLKNRVHYLEEQVKGLGEWRLQVLELEREILRLRIAIEETRGMKVEVGRLA
jgi:hypothetical protein